MPMKHSREIKIADDFRRPLLRNGCNILFDAAEKCDTVFSLPQQKFLAPVYGYRQLNVLSSRHPSIALLFIFSM